MITEERLLLFPGRVKDLMVGSSTEFSFESRIYNSVNIVTIIWLLIMSFGNFAFKIYGAMAVTLLMAAIQMVLYYYSRVKNVLYIPMSIHGLLSYAALAINYYYNSGVNGPTIFLFFFCFQLLIVTTPRKQHILWIMLSLITPIGLLVFEYYHPYTVAFSYQERFDRFADIIFSYGFSFFFIYYLTIGSRNQFESERKLVKDHSDVIEVKMQQLQQSEARLQAFFQNTENVYVLLDENLNLVTFNKAAKDWIMDYENREMAAGENIFTYINTGIRTMFFNKMEQALKGEVVEFEFKAQTTGYEQWWYIQFNPVFTSARDVIGIACTGSNINERKMQEQRILAKNEALMKIAHYQSHDLRGPVTSIMGLLNIINEERANAPEECYVLLDKAVKILDAKIHKVIDLTDALTD